MIHDRFPMLEALHAEGPAPDRSRHMMLYGQFVGSWDGRFVYHAPEGVPREAPCEVHFGWALEGRCSGRLDHALAVGATSPRRVGAGYACMAPQCASTIREVISGTSSGLTRSGKTTIG